MIKKCICYDLYFSDIVMNNIPLTNICNKCRMCNPYIAEAIKTGIFEFPLDYFKKYDNLKKDELEN